MLINSIVYFNLLTLNTYYLLNKVNSNSKLTLGNKIIQYNNCVFYNNKCAYDINNVFPDLNKYNNIYEDEFNISLSKVIEKIQELKYYVISTENKIMIDMGKLGKVFMIGTPIGENRCRLFIFNNMPEYKKIMLYVNLKLMIYKINVMNK
jgi:hypothetical protein